MLNRCSMDVEHWQFLWENNLTNLIFYYKETQTSIVKRLKACMFEKNIAI